MLFNPNVSLSRYRVSRYDFGSTVTLPLNEKKKQQLGIIFTIEIGQSSLVWGMRSSSVPLMLYLFNKILLLAYNLVQEYERSPELILWSV